MAYPDWKIIYGDLEGPQQRAVEFLYREMGTWIIRKPGVYTIYTMACLSDVNVADIDTNAVIIGTLDNCPALRDFINKEDIPENGYLIRIIENPGCPDKNLVLIAGDTTQAVLYGAIDFIDITVPEVTAELGNGLRFINYTLHRKMPDYELARAPLTKIRNVFSWGHTVNNFRDYIEKMARLKLNEIIMWNDFPPLNAREIVEYAHSWGMKLIWGFAWGWTTGCKGTDSETLKGLSDSIYSKWKDVWSKLDGDGIYFQSFTETELETNNGISIAEAAVDLVNKTAGRILAEKPDQRLIFGLHATSVKNKLDVIAKTDPRICILWEDCGGFPFRGDIMPDDETDRFLNKLMEQKRDMGLVFKGMMMMEWGKFAHQAGPYVLGNSSDSVIANDASIIEPGWRHLKLLWKEYGDISYSIAKKAHANSQYCTMLNITGNLTGKIQWPTALCAEMMWSTEEPYSQIINKIIKLPYLE